MALARGHRDGIVRRMLASRMTPSPKALGGAATCGGGDSDTRFQCRVLGQMGMGEQPHEQILPPQLAVLYKYPLCRIDEESQTRTATASGRLSLPCGRRRTRLRSRHAMRNRNPRPGARPACIGLWPRHRLSDHHQLYRRPLSQICASAFPTHILGAPPGGPPPGARGWPRRRARAL